MLLHVSPKVTISPLSSLFSLITLQQATRNNGVLFHAKRTKNPPLIRAKLRTLYLLEREASHEEAEEDVVGVAAVVALLAVALLVPEVVTATLTVIILTPMVALLHHLPQTATLNSLLIPGGKHPQSPALIATPAGAALRRPKPGHGAATLSRPGAQAQPQPPMVPLPLLLLSSPSPFLLLDLVPRLLPLQSFHGHKSPGVYSSFPSPVQVSYIASQAPRKATYCYHVQRLPACGFPPSDCPARTSS